MEPRQVDHCPFRRCTAPGASAAAHCGLLEELSGLQDASLCVVQLDACQACCQSFAPTADELNPVVASFLYQLSSAIITRGGAPGCTRERAVELNRLAVQNIPSDEDLVESPPQSTAHPEAAGLEQLVPRPRRRRGSPVRNWAVGVTTAPRAEPTLEACLESMAVAGFPQPRLFVDGEVSIPERFLAWPRTHRDPRMGAWPSYYLALAELLMRQPDAEAFLLVQDDALFAPFPETRDYLQRVLWPGPPGLATLFCSRAYVRPQPGWYRFEGLYVWSAQAFVFSRQAAQQFLADSEVLRHRSTPDGLASIDSVIGRWALHQGIPIYYPVPSLVQHIGHVSALWKNTRAFGNRRASWFAGG
ncbi:MAG: hypothetical protein WD847_05400 [Pirellulales bacterium]